MDIASDNGGKRITTKRRARKYTEKDRDRKKLYYQKNRDKIMLAARRRLEKIPESERYKRTEQSRINNIRRVAEWKSRNPEKVRGYQERYRNRNKNNPQSGKYDENLDAVRRWKNANPERIKERVRAWNQANRGRKRAIGLRRRLRMEKRTPAWVDWAELNEVYKNCPDGMEVDHIVPIAGITAEGYKISGLHVPWNLQYLTPAENMSKGNRMRHEVGAPPNWAVPAPPIQLTLW
jgi:hypothetical protein